MKIKSIAETAWHHEGDYHFLKNLVKNILLSKADIIKLHLTIDFDEYMDSSHPAYDMLSNWLFSEDQWSEILGSVKASDKGLMALVNDTKAVELASSFSPDLYEMHSVCLNDINLIDAINQNRSKESKVVLGVGGSSIDEIDNAINLLKVDESQVVLMFGFQNYPTKYQDINFNKIRKLMDLYPTFGFGYADHTAWDEPHNELISLMGTSSGCSYLEKHVTTDCGYERCDSSAAVSFDQFESICHALSVLSECNGDGKIRLNRAEREYSKFGKMKKAAIVINELSKGNELTKSDFVFKRASADTDLSQLDVLDLVGSSLNQDVSKGELLSRKFFEG